MNQQAAHHSRTVRRSFARTNRPRSNQIGSRRSNLQRREINRGGAFK